jgi:hypothetical protein
VDEYREWQIALPSLIGEIGRRFRAVLRMGLTWAVPWGLVGGSMTGLGVLLFLKVPPGLSLMTVAVRSALSAGIAASITGFVIGSAFGDPYRGRAESEALESHYPPLCHLRDARRRRSVDWPRPPL